MSATFVYIAFGIVIALVLAYFPPKSSAGISALASAAGAHWGDLIGFYVLHLGITLVIVGHVYAGLTDIARVGEELILAGVMALKLKTSPISNGNGNGTTTVTHIETETASTEKKPSES